MPKINLLPWRDEMRAQRRNQFYMGMGGALGFAAIVVLVGVLLMNSIIDAQNDRNAFLKDEIKVLDARITEILKLEEQKDRLVARMRIIEELQQSRPEVVYAFEELARTVPEGVHLTSIKQTGTRIEIKGKAESNTRVSAFMRNIDKAEWLEKPELQVVEVKAGDSGARMSEFTVFARSVRIKTEGEDS